MSAREFKMRLACEYANDNHISQISVQHQVGDNWVPFDLDIRTAGFDVFIYSVFTCQHTYFRVNAAEQGIRLTSSQGVIGIAADQDWNIERIDVHFEARTVDTPPARPVVDLIIERMSHCPVSINLSAQAKTQNRLIFR